MISTHVLDLGSGRPASGLRVTLDIEHEAGRWQRIGEGTTDADGRLAALGNARELAQRILRLRFETGAYFSREERPVFYPFVDIAFIPEQGTDRYHVPLILNAFGYSTYRGS
jgi:5-hydroxyisourate hydrolase